MNAIVHVRRALAIGACWFLASALCGAVSLMENLGRGVVVVRPSPTEAFVSWRILGTDPVDVAFNLYRSTGGGAAVLLNGAPLTGATHFADATADLSQANAYFVRPIFYGIEQSASASYVLAANAPVQSYLRVPLQRPAGGTTPVGEAFTYSPNDASAADLDGDGEYELVLKWEPSNAKDSSQDGYTGNTLIDAYKLDGTRLWRIDLGVNIRAGAHDTPFIVYDLDGDGRAEVSIKTASGTRDGLGNFVANPATFSGPFPSEPFDHNTDYRNASGRALVGPEFMTIFAGLTGAELTSTRMYPERHPTTDFPTPQQLFDIWGDTFGNRQGRIYPPGIAYLDGQRPSLIWGRGYASGQSGHPGRIAVGAWNWRDGVLTPLWKFDSRGHPQEAQISGQGGHTGAVADLNGDGLDDIVYGQVWLLHDGTLYHTAWGHGDALHISNMDPDRPGQQVFMPHESPVSYGPNALSYEDGATNSLIWGVSASGDIGRGAAADIDPRFRGFEMWGSGGTGGLYNAQQLVANAVLGPRAVQVAPTRPGQINHVVFWDGDLLRELLDGTTISKWDWTTESVGSVLTTTGIASINGTKSNPNLQVDLFGDWREEVIWRESTDDAVRIYVSTIPTPHRFFTLMHDRHYRCAITRQNVGYNQPPHPGYYLGDGMGAAPVPNIVTSLDVLLGPAAPVFTGITADTGASAIDQITNDQTLILHGTAEPDTTITVTRLGTGVIGTTTADGAGNWSLNYTGTTLPQGVALFTATATDNEGTGAPTNPPFIVEIDITPPIAPAIADVSDENGSLVFVGTAEANGTVAVLADGVTALGTALVDAGGSWSLTYAGPPLSAGPHTFTASTNDVAGNTGPFSDGSTVNTAITTPAILTIDTDTGAAASDGITSDSSLVFSGTAGPGDTVTLRQIGGATLGTTITDASGVWVFDHSGTTLADGLYAFSAAGSNVSGSSPSSPAFLVTIDTVAPTLTSIVRQNPTAATSTASSITFRVTFSESVEGAGASAFTPVFGGGLAGSIVNVVAAGAGVVDVTLDLTGEGTVRLDVVAATSGVSDTAGNALVADFTTGQVYTRALVGDGVWIRSTSGGLWSDNANWQNGVVADTIGRTANFATLEIDDDNLVRLDSPRTIGNVLFGDSDIGSAADWIVGDNGDPANTLTFATVAGSPTISVSPLGLGATATLDVSLAGNQGLTKVGTGTLLLTKPSSLTGPWAISAGSVRVESGATGSASTVNIASGGARLNLAGAFTATGTLTVNAGGGSALIVDSGTGTFATLATNNSAGALIRINGGTVTATGVNLPRSNDNSQAFGNGFVVAGGDVTVNGVVGIGTNNSYGVMSVEGDGSLRVNGPVRVGDLGSNSNRGGVMRVINNAVLVVQDLPPSPAVPEGIILTRRNNNTSLAFFDGGVTITNKLSIGAASVVTGSATVHVRGGALYLGSGGLTRQGTPNTLINLQSGLLGADADWSTAVPVSFPAGGNIAIHAADTEGAPFNISLTGGSSGAGGFTKTGAGRLTLGGTNTFTGGVAVSAGDLEVDGAVGAGADLAVNQGGLLSGDGSIDRAVVLNAGGTIMPGTSSAGSLLTAASLLWQSDGALAYDLDTTSNQLALSGALAKGGDAPHPFVFNAGPGIAAGNVYTLVTFGSTDFTAADFTFDTLAPGLTGAFFVNANDVTFKVYGPPIILESPENVALPLGGTATFSVSVGESPTLEYQWFKNGVAIVGATASTLVIPNVQGYDIASYHVVVTNAAGSTASAAATLSIQALALVNRGPSLNSSEVFGSIQQMLGTNATLNGDMAVTGNLFAPGTPQVVVNGTPNYGGTIDSSGATTPTGYTLTINSGTTLGHVVRRTNPLALPTVATPVAPAGTRSVTLNNASQSVGDWSTVRNLTLNQNAGQVVVPAGAYGAFAVNGTSGFTLGVAGATTPSVYHLQSLTLNKGSKIQVVGPVLIVVSGSFNVSGATVGAAAHPEWLTFNLHGGVGLNSGTRIDGYVIAPAGQVTINASSEINGGLAADRLTMNSDGVLDLLGPAPAVP